MSKMIQIRNVPDAVHRSLKVKAAQAGLTLSDFLLREVRQLADRPTLEEVLARIAERKEEARAFDSAAAVRLERESRR